ncbi:HSP70 family [Trichoderma barbatum]
MPQPYQTQASAGEGTDQEPTIIIGIDFSTTYSGVAWTTSSRPGHINIITNWNAVKSHCSDKEKVRSTIYYDNNGDISWGYSIPEKTSSAIEWFKLCLLDEGDIPEDIRNAAQIKAAQKALKESNRRVVDVIGDYLGELWKHSIVNIRRAIGGQLVDISKFKVVATLPAIWPAYAQIRLQEAIEKAGILKKRSAGHTILEFLSEPEAAALATINDMYAYSKTTMEVRDHFIVCDAGGGTVDVITYTVIKTSPIRVKESVRGDGKLCGATFLDEIFLAILRGKLHKMSPDAWQLLEQNGALGRIINNDWENGIKPQFRNTDQHWVLQMPSSGPKRKRSHDQFRFSDIKLTADVQGIFKPVVAEVENLVTNQAKTVKKKYKKEPKFIVLVGGFGRQPFLYTRIEDQLNRKKSQKGKTEVLQGSGAEPWTAVCRGAVIRGLEISDESTESTVDSRIARMSYGQVIRRISYDVKMTSNGVTLDFEVIYNNQVVASKKIGIDYGRCGSTLNQSLGDPNSDSD